MRWEKAIRVREEVLRLQSGICPYCDRRISETTNHHRNHNQHDYSESNVVVCCEKCHRKMNTVETIFQNANDRLRQEIVYSILRVAPPHLAKELVRGESDSAIARIEGTTIFSDFSVFKDNEEISDEV